jgi:sulfite oxidase
MPDLIVRSTAPFNAESRLDLLRSRFITSQSDFYVRSHGDIPILDEAIYHLSVRSRVGRTLKLSMRDLRTGFPPRSAMALMQCAGNRRADLNRGRPVTGDKWEPGAIGNAAWTGVSLADVLRAAEADTCPTRNVAFEASDPGKGGGVRRAIRWAEPTRIVMVREGAPSTACFAGQ